MKKKLRSAFLLESLETRLLFSADLAPMPVDAGNSGAEVESGLEISLQPDNGGMQAAETTRQEQREAIFVDAAVDDYQQLIDDIESQLEKGRQFDIVALDSDHDGIAQISDYLSQQQDVAAVHIISHGADGEVFLGNGLLNATTLDGYAEAIEGWQQSLSSNADLLFYGCNLAAGADGQELVNSLTLLTGADVAASDDVTGSAQFGGDWVLEYGKGEIETASAINPETHQNWRGVLATFIVNTTADTIDVNLGDGNAEDAAGNTSLRAAIMEANALGGTNTINFDIPLDDLKHYYFKDDGSGNSLSLVAVTDLDDASIADFDPDYPGTPYSWFSIKPSSILPAITDPVIIDATTQPGYAGKPIIELDGTDVSGSDSNGLTIQGGNSTVRGLVINRFQGTDADALEIEINGGNTIAGNYIGTDVTGTQQKGNRWGINLKSVDNMIGGTNAVDRNVVSGNINEGFYIYTATATGNFLSGNYIGVDATGSAPLGNGSHGVYITNSASNTTIVGNIISGNTGHGIAIDNDDGGNIIEGNLIGTDVDGLVDLGNTLNGVDINDSANNRIGGATPGAGNLISGNLGRGIVLEDADFTEIYGNLIGTDARGMSGIGNGGSGIHIVLSSNDNTIGGTNPGESNVIAFNGLDGIHINTARNTIRTNEIFGNSAPNEIHLAASGNPTAVEPTVSNASSGGGITTVRVSVSGASVAAPYEVDLFSNSTNVQEGQVYLGSVTVTGDPQDVVLNTEVAHNHYITATATNLVGAPETSEFSGTTVVTGPVSVNTAPVLDPSIKVALNPYLENAGPPLGAVGTLVRDLVDLQGGGGKDNLTDPDVAAIPGIAVISADTSNGTWHYSTDNGMNWFALGAVSINSGRLLAANDASTRIYFQPNPSFSGSISDAIYFRAWDQTDLNANGATGVDTTIHGGTSAFSLMFASASITVNNAPSAIALDSTTVAENADGAIIGNLSTTDPDSGDTHNYTVDDARFEVVAGQLKLQAGETLDFETEPSINLNITSTDAGGLSIVQGFTLTVSNVNEAPSAIALDNTTVAENADGAIIGNLSTTDPDSGDTHNYTVDDARFEVVAGQLKLQAGETLDFETEPSINLNITSTDAGGLSIVQGFTLTVSNVNEAPSAIALDNTTVAENADGAIIGNLSTTDPDSGDTHNYTVDDARFEVVAGQLKLQAGETLDFETEPSINLNITSTDAGGLSIVQGFTLTVSNVNEAPSAIALDNTTVAENADGAIIGNLSTTDPDSGDTHNYTVDDARFEVVAGQLKLQAGETLDFETEPSINLNITSTDAGGLSIVQGFTLTVSNVNEVPSAIALDNTTVAENADGAIIGNLSTTDPDSGDTHNYTVDDARFEVVAGQLKLQAGETLDFETEPSINLNITSTDAGGLSIVQGFTLTVSNVNEVPSAIALDNTTVAENADGAIIGNLSTTDPDSGDTHNYTVDDARFEVVAGQLKLQAGETLDFETEPSINLNITSTDAGGLSIVQGFTLTVSNVNEAPIAVNDNLNATEDQSIAFASITDLLGNDSDIDGDALTLAGFTQPANGMLVDNGDGTLTYTPSDNFYGTDSFSYTIDDGNGETASGTAIIVVAPVGDIPQVTNVSTDAEVQSGLIFINRNASDGVEISHFKISGITNGALYLADGVTRIDNGDYITVAQGQAGLRFTPTAGSVVDGSFNVESSEDGVSVAPQSGIATSMITVMTPAPAPPPPEPQQGLLLSEPEIILREEVVEEETEDVEDPVDETDVQAGTDNIVPVETPQPSKTPGMTKPSFKPGIASLRQGDMDSGDSKTPGRSTLLIPQTLKILIEAENLGELKDALGKVDIATLSPNTYELMRNSLDAIKDEIGKEILLDRAVLGSAIATSVGLSAGYVVWMLKGGSLLASLLSSLPAWQLTDPLAILVGKKEDDDDEDNESLETIIEEGSGQDKDKDKDKKSKAPELNSIKKESAKR